MEITLMKKALSIVPVLFLAFCVVCARTHLTLRPGSNRRHHRHDKNDESTARKREQVWQRLQGRPSDCCPTVTETVAPLIGRGQSGKSLELVRTADTVQRFNETSCKKGYKGKPCRYIIGYLREFSQCVQQYSYVYALVKDPNSQEGPRLDYIQIRSGCSCQLIPPANPPAPP